MFTAVWTISTARCTEAASRDDILISRVSCSSRLLRSTFAPHSLSMCMIRSPLHKIQEDIWRQFERTTIQELASPEFTLLRDERGPHTQLQNSA